MFYFLIFTFSLTLYILSLSVSALHLFSKNDDVYFYHLIHFVFEFYFICFLPLIYQLKMSFSLLLTVIVIFSTKWSLKLINNFFYKSDCLHFPANSSIFLISLNKDSVQHFLRNLQTLIFHQPLYSSLKIEKYIRDAFDKNKKKRKIDENWKL